MTCNKEIKCTSENNFKIPNFNRNFKKICPTIFAGKPISKVDITNIYETLSLVQEMAQLYSLEYKFDTIETLVEYISKNLSYIYKLEEQQDPEYMSWDKIHINFKLNGNPFNYETYLSKLETDEYIYVSQYFFVNNIYNLLYLPRVKNKIMSNSRWCVATEDSPFIKPLCSKLSHNSYSNKHIYDYMDKKKLYNKKNRISYLRLTYSNFEYDIKQVSSSDMILSEKQILRYSKMPEQKKIMRKIFDHTKKNKSIRYLFEDISL